MNAITQRNRLDATLKSYMDFMPFCPRDSFLKLSNEMVKINSRLEAIKCMTLKELMTPVEFQYETANSRVNIIEFAPSLQSIVAPEKKYNFNKTNNDKS